MKVLRDVLLIILGVAVSALVIWNVSMTLQLREVVGQLRLPAPENFSDRPVGDISVDAYRALMMEIFEKARDKP